MSGSTESARQPDLAEDRRRERARLAKLEADVAYFQARLEIIGDPETTNQLAQRRAFGVLSRITGEELMSRKRRLMEAK